MRKICAVIQRKGSMQGRRLTENQPPLSSSLQKRYRKPLEISIKWFRCGSSCISFALLQRSCCSIHRLSSSITQRGHYAAGEYGLIYLLSSFTWELSALSNDDRNDMEKFLSWQTPKSIATVQHDEFILAIFFRFFFFFCVRVCFTVRIPSSTSKPPPLQPPAAVAPRDASTHPHQSLLCCVEAAHAPTAAVQIQSKVSSSRRYSRTKKHCSSGTNPHNLSSNKPRAWLLIGRDGAGLNNLCRNAPTWRSADEICIIYSPEQRGGG